MKAKITLLNKLKRQDSQTGLEVWYKTFLDVDYYSERVQNVTEKDVSMNETFTVLIPFSDKYHYYHLWKSMNKDNIYTLSQGDYIVFGEVEEEITPNNIQSIVNQYRHCEVRSIEEREKILDANYQFKVGGV